MQNLGIALSFLAKPNTGIRPQGTNHLEEEAGGKGQILHLPFLPLLFPVPAGLRSWGRSMGKVTPSPMPGPL